MYLKNSDRNLVLFLLLLCRIFCIENGWHVCEQNCADEDEQRADPVSCRERILKVDDGEYETDELSQRGDQSDRQRRAFGGENKDRANANVLR